MATNDAKELLRLLAKAVDGDVEVNVERVDQDSAEGLFGPSAACPEAQVMDLEIAFQNYMAGVKAYKPGDLVTPRKGYGLRHAGQPHIVLEVDPNAPVRYPAGVSPGNPNYGERMNLRIAGIVGHGNKADLLAWWCEAFQVEPYTGPRPAKN